MIACMCCSFFSVQAENPIELPDALRPDVTTRRGNVQSLDGFSARTNALSQCSRDSCAPEPTRARRLLRGSLGTCLHDAWPNTPRPDDLESPRGHRGLTGLTVWTTFVTGSTNYARVSGRVRPSAAAAEAFTASLLLDSRTGPECKGRANCSSGES